MNNFAVSSDGLATALQTSGSALMSAGNDLNQSVALIASANKVLQDPSQVGAALRTIALRIRGTSLEVLEEMGEETDGVIESVSKLQEKVKAISGVDILDDSGAYRDTYDILVDLAAVWDEVGQKDPKGQAALLELLAGKNRSNALAAILGNLEDLEGAYDAALNAENSAQQELDTYMDSIEGRASKFTNALQTMWMNAISSDTAKWFVDAGTKLIEIFDQLNQHNPLGMFGSLVLLGGAIFGAWKGIPALWNMITASSVANKAAIAAETAAIQALDVVKAKDAIMDSTAITNDTKELALSALLTGAEGKETIATNLNTIEAIKNALAKKGIADADIEAIISAMELTAANTGLTFSFGALAKGIWATTTALLSSPLFWGVASIAVLLAALDDLLVSFKEAKEKLIETNEELDGVRSEIESLNSELESTKKRIKELNALDTLSFTEQKELEALELQNTKLQTQVDLLKQREELIKQQQINDAYETMQKDPSLNTTYYPGSNSITIDPKLQREIDRLTLAKSELEEAEKELLALQTDTSDNTNLYTWLGLEPDVLEKKKKKYIETNTAIIEDSEEQIRAKIAEYEELYGDLEWQVGENLTESQKGVNEYLKFIEDYTAKGYIEMAKTPGEIAQAYKTAFQTVAARPMFLDELEMIQDEAGVTGEKLYDMWENSDPDDPDGIRAYIQSLMDVGFISEISATSLQQVVDMALQLSDGASDAELANKKLARSQKRLKYAQLAKEIEKYTNRTTKLTDKEKEELKTKKEQLKVIAQEIESYNILGAEIEDIKSKYEGLETAKETDSERAYGDNLADAVSTLIEGYQTTKLGTEAVESARNILIPESVYEGAKTTREKLDKEYEYLTKTLGKFMNIEYDDDGVLSSVELTPNGTDLFLDELEAKGLMTYENGIWEFTDAASKDLATLAEQAGVTKDVLYAFFTAIDEMNANRGLDGNSDSIFDHLIQDTETQLYKALNAKTNAELALIEAQDALVAAAEKGVDSQEYADALSKYNEAHKNYNNTLVDYSKLMLTARSDAAKFLETQELYNAQQEEVNELLTEYNDISKKDGDTSEIEKKIEEATELLGKYGSELEKYGVTEFTITVAMDQIDSEIKAIEDKFTDFKNQVEFDNESGKYQLKASVSFDEGTEEKAAMDSYLALLNERHSLDIFLGEDAIDSLTVLQDISDTLQIIADALTGVTEKNWVINVGATISSTLQKFWDWISGNSGEVDVQVTPSSSTTGARGNAMAGGSSGVKQNGNALVGELGPELRVRDGRYELIGENGAEFTDVRKGDIIFNHKQTEDILRNGHISSRGKAFVNGNAFNVGGYVYAAHSNSTATGGLTKDLQNLGKTIDGASDSAKDEFDELIDWFEILTEELEHHRDVLEAQLELAIGTKQKSAIYDSLVDIEYQNIEAYTEGIKLYTNEANKFLAKIPAKYVEMAKNGSVAITEFIGEANENTIEAIENYRDNVNKAHDLELQTLESTKRISELRLEKFDSISQEYENQIQLAENLNDLVQANIDLAEEKGERVSAKFYENMIDTSNDQLEILKDQRKAMQAELDDAVKSGQVQMYSEEWYDMVNAINDVDSAIIDCESDIESYNNAIQDLHWENFDKLAEAIENVAAESEHIRGLFDDDDIVDEDGNWTKEGITSLGMLMQEMENAEYRVKLYSDEIEYLNQEYAKGNISVDEYNEKMQELKEGQWDAIDAYESAKDSIIDLNKVRIEAVKDGMQKEIDAYEELINKRKEDLQLQKDEYDWENTINDHTDTINAIQRKIDALTGDTSAAAEAQRKQLQEELANAEKELQETYYNKEIETQQAALDDSLELYREGKEAAMEELDEYLKKEEQVLNDSYNLVLNNTELVNQTILDISSKYGIEIEKNVVEPWSSGMTALDDYSEKFGNLQSSYVQGLEGIKTELAAIQTQADLAAKAILNMLTTQSQKVQTNVEDIAPSNNNPSNNGKQPDAPAQPANNSNSGTLSTGQTVKVDTSATNFSSKSGNAKMASFVKGGTYTVMQTSGDQVLIGKNGVATGWVKKTDLQGYASGTTNIKKNQLAWIDENGLEEIVMHAEGGKLAYLTKGSAVLPNDISENLMKIGSVDPSVWLSRNKANVAPTNIVTNNNVIDMSIANLINIEHADRDSIPEIQDAVKKQLDSYMKNLNSGLKKYTR